MQRMTGKASTPIARSNSPVSIFAEEKTMASRKHAAQAAIAATAEPVAATPVVETPVAAKPAKTPKDPAKVAAAVAKLQQSPLDRVVAAQAGRVDHGIIRHFTARVQARLAAGQDYDTALRETFAQYAELVATVIATTAAADQDADSKAAEFATGK